MDSTTPLRTLIINASEALNTRNARASKFASSVLNAEINHQHKMLKIFSTGIFALCTLALHSATLAQNRAPESSKKTNEQSIKKWTKCDGQADDLDGTAQAFSAAKNNQFILVVDCPVKIKIGMDINKPIFIESGTTVKFKKGGVFLVDNTFLPAWVIANSEDINLTDWRIQYMGGLPLSPDTKGYFQSEKWIDQPGKYQPSAAFNDITLTNWLSKNKGIIFDSTKGKIFSPWYGPSRTSAIFYIIGGSKNINITRMKLSVPKTATGEKFIPTAFQSSAGFKSNTSIDKTTTIDSNTSELPNHINIYDLSIDGSYMGWAGTLQYANFSKIRSYRYGDLQDKYGENIGGEGKWFLPPHLFYLATDETQKGLENKNITISDVIDYGKRIGNVRDKRGEQPTGNSLSIKFGGNSSKIYNYKSFRPDGVLDILNSEDLELKNIVATYDSHYLQGMYPAIRFPGKEYKNVKLTGIKVEDLALSPQTPAIGTMTQNQSSNIVLKDVITNIKKQKGTIKTPQ